MAIQVTLEDHTGNIRKQAKLSESAAVEQLIRAIITALKMPVTDSAGRPITYYLAHNGRRLQENDTLASAEVRASDTISIVPQMTAGAFLDSDLFIHHPFFSDQPWHLALVVDPLSGKWGALAGRMEKSNIALRVSIPQEEKM